MRKEGGSAFWNACVCCCFPAGLPQCAGLVCMFCWQQSVSCRLIRACLVRVPACSKLVQGASDMHAFRSNAACMCYAAAMLLVPWSACACCACFRRLFLAASVHACIFSRHSVLLPQRSRGRRRECTHRHRAGLVWCGARGSQDEAAATAAAALVLGRHRAGTVTATAASWGGHTRQYRTMRQAAEEVAQVRAGKRTWAYATSALLVRL